MLTLTAEEYARIVEYLGVAVSSMRRLATGDALNVRTSRALQDRLFGYADDCEALTAKLQRKDN